MADQEEKMAEMVDTSNTQEQQTTVTVNENQNPN